MRASLRTALSGSAVAVAVTAAMDAGGLTMFSALPLLPLALLFRWRQGIPFRALGLAWGRGASYGSALLYPAVVPGALALAALAAGAAAPAGTDWPKTGVNALLGGTVGTLAILLTEEGFFRGWLWAASTRAGLSPRGVLLTTTVVFTAWHVSAVTLTGEFGLPAPRIPVFLANVFLIGLVWGLVRLQGGSVLAPSVSHAVWNALVYGLFGFGTRTGGLGIAATDLFGPEVGLFGLAANLAFAAWLWRRVRPSATPAGD